MQGVQPRILAGVAGSGWALIRPLSLSEKIKKAALLIAIRSSPLVCSIPGLGKAILALRRRREISY
jgi:hypothetical protein